MTTFLIVYFTISLVCVFIADMLIRKAYSKLDSASKLILSSIAGLIKKDKVILYCYIYPFFILVAPISGLLFAVAEIHALIKRLFRKKKKEEPEAEAKAQGEVNQPIICEISEREQDLSALSFYSKIFPLYEEYKAEYNKEVETNKYSKDFDTYIQQQHSKEIAERLAKQSQSHQHNQ